MNLVMLKLKLATLDWLYVLMIGLTIVGIAISAYLMWGYTVPGAELSCGGSSDCETVKDSPYSHLLGIPLPVFGLGAYFALLALLIAQKQAWVIGRNWQPYIALAIFAISLAGVLYSVYLTYIELFVIYAICRWCVGSAVVMVTIFPLGIFNLQRNNQ